MPVHISSLLQSVYPGLVLPSIRPTLARHLAFSPNICVRNMCSLSEGEAVGASNNQPRPVALPSWKRVQLGNEQNTSRIYQLLEAGSTQPEA
jgi:hypothetical protein